MTRKPTGNDSHRNGAASFVMLTVLIAAWPDSSASNGGDDYVW